MLSTSFIRLLALLVFTSFTDASFRVPCTKPLVEERLDPVNAFGKNPSRHVHTVHGAINFNANLTFDELRASNCTTCEVAEDLSDYWFPKLYFHDPKTQKFEAVSNNGLVVNYHNRGNLDKTKGGPGLKAFPPGFKMASGTPVSRSKKYIYGNGTQAELAERAISWECLRTTEPSYSSPGGFPHTDCEGGFISRVLFPSCWDGKNLDNSTDHKGHVAFLSDLNKGDCPCTHPVGFLQLEYVVSWDVHCFAGRWNESDGWPFVYATGDPTGFSLHGDFQTGWDVDVLQKAIDTCDSQYEEVTQSLGIKTTCSHFTVIPSEKAESCKLSPVVKEDVNGPFAKLPGCNPIQAGPGNAINYNATDCPV
ncbi:wsc domain protein [Moniliophthora roreri MCA 2997]|uniref:Wsc domain protein n=1 Tax=Moniliophthora roreri (strain MCA 2997) TaxID=1381753 RepID=V2XLS7_MONRO|nr:wsc domain protein [Moniliophthora roreri MCA 2997]